MKQMPSLSGLDWHILGLLVDAGSNPMYGLDMVKRSRKLKRGTIYVNLAKLQKLGLVEVKQTDGSGARGRPRNQYRLSAKGARLMAAQEVYRNGLEAYG